jgi:hypothetical protein
MTDHCPKCGAALVSEPIGSPYRCKHCDWHLVTIAEWRKLSAFQQGYVHYMQASWPTSELAAAGNHYGAGTAPWHDFREGARRAVLDAQDGEE